MGLAQRLRNELAHEARVIALMQVSDAQYYKVAMNGYDPLAMNDSHTSLQRYAAKRSANTRRRLLEFLSIQRNVSDALT